MENKIIDIAWVGSSTAFTKKFGTTLPRYVDANKNVIYWCCTQTKLLWECVLIKLKEAGL